MKNILGKKTLGIALLFVSLFPLQAQRMIYGIKGGFIYAKTKEIDYFKDGFEQRMIESKAIGSNKGWMGSLFLNVKYRSFLFKNELIYSQFSNQFKNKFGSKRFVTNYRIDYKGIPTLKIKKVTGIYLGPMLSYLIKRKETPSHLNYDQEKFMIGIFTGINLFIQKIIIDLGMEVPLFLTPSPYLFSLSIGYGLNRRH